MAENRRDPSVGGCFKEAVCIDAGRVYDSCSDRDCLENLQVVFVEADQEIIDQACSIKCKDVDIIDVYINVESVPFNKGFYSVDITFFFEVKFCVYLSAVAPPTIITGATTFSKKVILYGSEGCVKVFSSQECGCTPTDLPKATVQVVNPICLDSKLCDCSNNCCNCNFTLPEPICGHFCGKFCFCNMHKVVYVTLGLFTIVQLERRVQMMIPAYDFCIPDNCEDIRPEDPCELFHKLKFPMEQFFPPKLNENGNCGC